MSDSVRPHRWQPTRLPCPWDSPGKNTGMDCHFLLQCMKVKSESEVTQSRPTLHDSMDWSPPGSSFRGIFQARVLEWIAIAFSPQASRASQSESQLPPRLPFPGAGRRCGLHLFARLAPPRGHVSPPSGARDKVQRFVLGASSSSASLPDLPGRTLSYCHFPEERRLPRWPWW